MYATTAANSHESSYACYYDEKRDTYLGDWYSVNWMEDSDVVGEVSPVVFEPQHFVIQSFQSCLNYKNLNTSYVIVCHL